MSDNTDDDVGREERAIYAIIAAAGTPVLIAAAVEGGAIDSGTTLCLVIVAGGVLGFLWRLRRAARIPRAQLRRRSRYSASRRR